MNPRSGAGSAGRRWPSLEPRLRDALGPLEVEHTRGPRDAERIAREAVRSGVCKLIVAGGDGTVSEVVSGVLEAGLGKEAEIGLLPLGTGCDFARTLNVPKDIDAALEALRTGTSRRIDAGRIRYVDRAGRARTSYFLNEASFGISGLVVDLVNEAPKWLGGPASFLIGTLRALVRHRAREARLVLDGQCIHEGPLTLGVAANGRFFGGGMQIAPRADLASGSLDVVVISEMSKLELVRSLPSLYRGTHELDSHVSVHRGCLLEVEARPGELPIDVDGESLGSLPATIEVLPGAIALYGLPAPPLGN